ncbi:mRNA surveillance protein pelota [Candidatus Woesearchaeota archaeon]|nr:mRNA surveillance protein pelota [Candidatus Woesearchaeota archaeon]
MRILKHHRKEGFLHVKADAPEDLWLLSRLIGPGDAVKGSTERKLKLGGEDDRNQKVVRKKMTLTLRAEKATYEHDSLRVLGTITDGPDEVAKGDHHAITIQPGDELMITKEWQGWQLNKLQEATERSEENIIVVLFDREEALFCRLTNTGHDVLSRIKGEVSKKGEEGVSVSDFWKAIARQASEYDQRYQPRSIIAASPAFWKDYLKESLPEDLAKKAVYATVSSTNEQSLQELLRRPEVKQALREDRGAQEDQLVQELLGAVAKDQAAYGIDEVERKANEGCLKTLLVSDSFMMQERERGDFVRVEQVMKAAEQGKALITIVASKESMKQLDGLGGIAGLRRW